MLPIFAKFSGLVARQAQMIKLTVKLGRDRSRDVAMVTNLSLFISHNFFRNSDQRVINIVHLATMRSIAVARRCNTRGRPSTSFVEPRQCTDDLLISGCSIHRIAMGYDYKCKCCAERRRAK